MKNLKFILASLLIISLYYCGDSGNLPFKGSGFGGPQNNDEARIAKRVSKTPIVFIHGYTCVAAFWYTARDFFLKKGYSPHEIFAINLNVHKVNLIFPDVRQLKDFVRKVLKYTGKKKVILVAHSRGGMVARIYIKMFKGYDFVEKCILIASPTLGLHRTQSVNFILATHPFMINLNKPDKNVNKVKFMCIAADNDEFFPAGYNKSYNFLSYAENIVIPSTDHISVAKDERTFKKMLTFIEN